MSQQATKRPPDVVRDSIRWRHGFQDVVFLPKRQRTFDISWQHFGGSQADYERWIPHACGILCLKMITDTYGIAGEQTQFALIKRSVQVGGFVEHDDGRIEGVFHQPLISIAKELGLNGEVMSSIYSQDISLALRKSHFIVLSIDLAKLDDGKDGSHLVLVHSVDENDAYYLVHDCAGVLGTPGNNVVLSTNQMENISNHRGLAIWR